MKWSRRPGSSLDHGVHQVGQRRAQRGGAGAQQLGDPALPGVTHPGQRRPDVRGTEQARLLQHPLGRGRVGLGEDHVHQRVQREVQLARLLLLTRRPQLVHLRHGDRRQVGHRADEADPAEGEQRQAQQLDAGPDQDVPAALVQHAGEVLEVPGGLLDPDDVAILPPQPGDGLRRDVDGGAGRDVVDDDGQVRVLGGHGRVPLEQALLGRPRVVRRDHQRRVRAKTRRRRGELERLVEPGRTGAGQERHPVRDHVGRLGHRGDPLLRRLRARLAGRAAQRDAVRAAVQLPADQAAQALGVELPVPGERGDHGGDGSAQGRRVAAESHGACSPLTPLFTEPLFAEPGLVRFPPAFAERVQPVELRAGRDLGGDELFLPLLLAGRGEDLRRQAGREHDHAVVVADHQVARLDRDARAGHRDAPLPRDVPPAEHGGVDGRVIGGDIQLGQPGGVPDGAVRHDAGRAADLGPQGQDVADGPGRGLLAGVDHEHLTRPDLLDRLLLGVHPAAVRGEQVLTQRQVAQGPGEPGHPQARLGRAEAVHGQPVQPSLAQLGGQGGGGYLVEPGQQRRGQDRGAGGRPGPVLLAVDAERGVPGLVRHPRHRAERRQGVLGLDDRAAQLSRRRIPGGDLDLNQVARLHDRRPGRRPGQDDVSRFQGHQPGQVRDDVAEAEEQFLAELSVLRDLPVLPGAQAQRAGIDLAGVEQPRPERRQPVDALGADVAPAVGVTQVVHGEVVGGRHPGDMAPGGVAVHPAGPAADHERYLALEGEQPASGRPGHGIIAGGQGRRRLEEVGGPGRYGAALERPAPVAHMNRDDLRRRCAQHRHLHAHGLGHSGIV